MKWWRIWHGIFILHDHTEMGKLYLYSMAWTIAPCHEGWAFGRLPPPANDNGWWMGS